jgi:hypothetical protein
VHPAKWRMVGGFTGRRFRAGNEASHHSACCRKVFTGAVFCRNASVEVRRGKKSIRLFPHREALPAGLRQMIGYPRVAVLRTPFMMEGGIYPSRLHRKLSMRSVLAKRASPILGLFACATDRPAAKRPF